MPIRNSYIASRFYLFSDRYILPLARRFFQTPNQITSIGAALAMCVPIGFWLHPLSGCLFLMVSALADVLDGQFARATGRKSDFGAFWDSSLDRVADFFYLLGFWILFRHDRHFFWASFLIFYGLITTLMISYVKARAEAMGKSCRSGLMERGLRTIYLFFWALLLGIISNGTGFLLWFGLGLFCTLTTITVIQRIIEIRSQFFSP